MRAYKFLLPGAIAPFSRHPWPAPAGDAPGGWVERSGDGAVCRGAVHACGAADLPWWLQAELWEVELAEPVEAVRHKLTAARGRLVRRVAGWDVACAARFAEACAWRVRDRAVQALEAAGAPAAAEELRGYAGLEDMLAAAERLSPPPEARINVAMAGDGAANARPGVASTSAYIAAHAAGRIDGPAGMAAERAWQAAWLATELGLPS
jgi:hypothetical protein